MRLALVLPGVAIGFAGAIILGPGNTRAVPGARVHVAPATDGQVPSARVVVVRRLDGAEEPAGGQEVVVETGATRAAGRTGVDGVVEVVFDPPARPGAAIVVRSGDRILARGPLEVPSGEPPAMQLGAAIGRAEGALRIRLAPLRGQVTPPFAESIAVRLTRLEGGREVEAAGRVDVELIGGSPATAALDVDPARGPGHFALVPEALRVDVEARARDAAGREGKFSGSFDTVPGAMWLDPTSGDTLRVASPAPRDAAYLSLHTARGRVVGFVVPLADAGDGFHRGEVALPGDVLPLRARGGAVLVAAGDPEERGPATVAWPLAADGGSAVASRLVRALDGVRDAESRERERASSARRIAVAVAAACGLASIVSLVLEGRRAQRALEKHLQLASEGATAEARADFAAVGQRAARAGSTTATVLGALVALAFGIVAALVLVR